MKLKTSKSITCSTTIGEDSSVRVIKLKKNIGREIPEPTIEDISKITVA